MDLLFPAFVFIVMLASAYLGWLVQSKLHVRHTTRETYDSVRLLMGMLLTFAALVLGLLTSNAKDRFDGYNKDLSYFSAGLIDLDQRLRAFGPDTAPIREDLRTYTAAALADSWPDEVLPTGTYPRFKPTADIERQRLGEILYGVNKQIQQLPQSDDYHRTSARRLERSPRLHSISDGKL